MDEIIPSNVEEADQLISDNSDASVPMEMDKPAPAPQAVDEHVITVDGKQVKANLDKIKQWASMGHGAPTKIGQLNNRIKELESVETKFKQYSEIDNYAKTNPDWWKHIETSWQTRSQANPNSVPDADPLLNEIKTLKEELSSIKSFKDEITHERVANKIKSEDDALNTEINSIENNYPDIDFITPDETGKSLQTKILEHAQSNGITSYRAAFRDLFHDNLVKMAQEKGKEALLKDRQTKTRLGVISESSNKTKGLKPVTNLKSKSYDMLLQEGLQELEA